MAGATAMSRRRSALVWALVVLATILTLVSSLTVWTKRQFLNTDAWTNAAGGLLANSDVQTALSNRLTDLINQRIDFTKQLEERLPPRAQSVAPVAAAAAQSATARVVQTFLASAQAQALWEDANRKAHKAIVNVLEGKNAGPVSTANGNVVLDLRPMIGKIATRLGVQDRVRQGASSTTGQIVILKSDKLGAAQAAVKILRVLSVLLTIVVLALYALAVYLARGRRRIVLESIGFSLVLTGIIVLVVQRISGSLIVDSLVKVDANKPAVNAAWLVETALLRDIGLGLLAYGVLVVLAGFMAGPSRVATAVRRAAAPTFEEHVVLVYVAAATLFLIVIAWGPTGATRRLLGIVILGAFFFAGLEVWRRQAIREFAGEKSAAAAQGRAAHDNALS